MRERLTLTLVAVSLLLLVGAGLMLSYVAADDVRSDETQDARATAAALAVVVGERLADGGGVDEAALTPYVTPRLRVTYRAPGSPEVVVSGAEHGSGDEGDYATASTPVTGGGTLTVSRHHEGVRPWGADGRAVLLVFAVAAVVAGAVGYVVARSISRPFQQLAVASAALGRGRSDLDLPRGGVREARMIASSLASSAEQLRERLERERDFGQHTSHILRTPLTSLRLRLEDLMDDPQLPPDARAAVGGSLKAVDQLETVAGELVELGGRGVLVAGAAVPLRDLATQVAQRWADRLDDDGRRLTAAVEGDIELIFTPGPVEQVLDLLLEDVVSHESGAVRLVFEGAASRLQVDLLCAHADGTRGAPVHPVDEGVQTLLDTMGGRLERPTDVDALRLYLPRR